MININSLHILLTYTCNYECNHCFVWGSPWQPGVLRFEDLQSLLSQAAETGMINEIWFEGGEPFLYFPLLVGGVRMASEHGFDTGIVSNAYWATSRADALNWLYPLVKAGLDEIDVSSDLYHGENTDTLELARVQEAAEELGLRFSSISVEPPSGPRDPEDWVPGEPLTGGDVMYRGRAAELLTYALPKQQWQNLKTCPYENLENPGRLHVDPLGNLHICQGIIIGNLFEKPLSEILTRFEPNEHPIAGPLLSGGPAKLIKKYHVDTLPSFVDACHACYVARLSLRARYPAILGPNQMYGIF